VFSPSGHRIYVALRDASALGVVDRFQRGERSRISLPGPAGAVRADPWGYVLFVRPAGAAADRDVTWVVSVAAGRVIGRLATQWDSDLPTVSEAGAILSREGDAVVARDVHTLDSLGAVPEGARDYWFLGAWTPAGGTMALRQQVRVADAAARRPPPAAGAAGGAGAGRPPVAPRAADPKSLQAAPDTGLHVWAQVSASQSESASRALVAELTAAQLPARLIPPRSEGDGWRVVLGPFATRDEAEAAGRALGRPFFVVERSLAAPARP